MICPLMYDNHAEECMNFIQSASRPRRFLGGKRWNPYFCKKINEGMKSYFKFLSRNKLYTAIEAFGLSIALAFVIILVSYASMEYRVGANHKLSKELYAVGSGDYLGMTAGTAKEFFPSIPEIKEWTRYGAYYAPKGAVVDGKFFDTKILSVDPNFLQLFDYRLTGCSSQRILTDIHQAIVTEGFAKKAFGSKNPIGQTVLCDTLRFKVVGVMEDIGAQDVFKPYEILVSMKLKDAVLDPMDQFGEVVSVVRLAKDANPQKVADKLLDKYLAYWPKFFSRTQGDNALLWGSTLTRWDKLYFSGLPSMLMRQGNQTLVNILLAVALVLLLSAIFNYINLTVAQIGNRAKEMATRRLMGETVLGVMMRYFKESALFTAVCFLLGGFMAWAFLPLFSSILDTKIQLLGHSEIWLSLVAAYLVIALLSGVLPAIVVSRFNPIDVVKGTIRLRSKMWFSKVFIVAQNAISMVLVVVAMTMLLQMHHLATMPMGYDTEDKVVINTSLDYSSEQHSILVNRLKALPEVVEATYCQGTPLECGANGVHDDKKECIGYLRMCTIDSTAMKMLGIKVLEQYDDPTAGKMWITESAKHAFGVTGKRPWFGTKMEDGYEYEVCGVIADYHSGSAISEARKNEYNAIRVLDRRKGFFYTALVKTRGDHAQALQAIKQTCKQVTKELTGVPIDTEAAYIDDTLTDSLKEQHNMMVLIITFMGISILISALGLFGMSVYYGNQQKRQIALRKVMGASTREAAWQLARRFLVCSVVAIVLAIPVCVKLMQHYLTGFVYRIDFPWWLLLVGAVFTLLVAFVAVIGRTLKTALSNPIDSIKTE